jgi:hypothetical protein
VSIDHLNLNIDGTPVYEPCGDVENGKLCMRVRAMKITGDELKIDDSVVAFKKKRRVDESDQKRLAPISSKKIPHESVIKPIDSLITHIDNFERNVIRHGTQYLLPPI